MSDAKTAQILASRLLELRAERDKLVSALSRLRRNAGLIFDKKPVRDWDETLHEADAVLAEIGEGE